jgi:hypothetical protein
MTRISSWPSCTGLISGRRRIRGFDYKRLNRAVERGARAILVRPAPVPGWKGPRSFSLPEFDPFWKRCSELGALAAVRTWRCRGR